MEMQICSCEGLDSNCKKCHGSGYARVSAAEVKSVAVPKKKADPGSPSSERPSSLPENLDSLSRKELEAIVGKIIGLLDLKSKKQMQHFNSIPFTTTTFRRDFKDKFKALMELEGDKRFLRSEIDFILASESGKKYIKTLSFGHFLSDKDIDITSNKEIKTLIREYRKQKAER